MVVNLRRVLLQVTKAPGDSFGIVLTLVFFICENLCSFILLNMYASVFIIYICVGSYAGIIVGISSTSSCYGSVSSSGRSSSIYI